MNKIKNQGQVYTPDNIVKQVIDMAGYNNADYPQLKVLENSCGDGAFIKELLSRGVKPSNIYVIDIDEQAIKEVEKNYPQIPKENIYLGSAFDKREEYAGMFDFVVGNPPYVRIHNIEEGMRNYIQDTCSFCDKGMWDLYLAFFNIGLECLKPNNGRLSYITPSSYLTSLAGKSLREYISNQGILSAFYDFGEEQVFDGYGTYTCITTLRLDKLNIIVPPWELQDTNIIGSGVKAQNGLATLCDEIYIQDDFAPNIKEEGLIRPIIKASTLEEKWCLYPYDDSKLIEEDILISHYPNTYHYLLSHKDRLLKRSLSSKTKWYELGRSQGIKFMDKEKIVVANINQLGTLRYKRVSSNYLVYSGLFIVDNLEEAEKLLNNPHFISTLQSFSIPKRGGYYSFTSNIFNKLS